MIFDCHWIEMKQSIVLIADDRWYFGFILVHVYTIPSVSYKATSSSHHFIDVICSFSSITFLPLESISMISQTQQFFMMLVFCFTYFLRWDSILSIVISFMVVIMLENFSFSSCYCSCASLKNDLK